MFSNLPKTNFDFSVTFILSSASAFNFDQSKNLLIDKELNMFELRGIKNQEKRGKKRVGFKEDQVVLRRMLQTHTFCHIVLNL